MRLFLGLSAAIISLLMFAACSSDNKGGGTVQVTMDEYSITVDRTSVPEGDIVFQIKNSGKEQHELTIVRTDIPADQLPKKDDGSANLDAPDVKEDKKAEEIDADSDTSRTFTIDAGNYVLIDNTVKDSNGTKIAYYDKGMRIGLTVTKEGESPSPRSSSSATPTPTHS